MGCIGIVMSSFVMLAIALTLRQTYCHTGPPYQPTGKSFRIFDCRLFTAGVRRHIGSAFRDQERDWVPEERKVGHVVLQPIVVLVVLVVL